MIVVCDTSAITNLAAIEYLNLLQALYGEIVIPEAVFKELVDIPEQVPGAAEVQSHDWIKTQPVLNTEPLESLLFDLDIGEAEAIVLALELKAQLLVIDERKGYQIASGLGLKVIGILGILLAAKAQGIIPAVQPVMDRLVGQAGFWMRRAVYRQILQLAQES
ncbi:DUF3368 domain-containing protein [Romeria aff. gracilis LEGE 07310]|uniref:DUF3368 domain-containing protein n=1 Tax=Vasconcelosia minhoensis LEGE 07310 TaxID=915328 RepID=A0A8J7DMI5_9CYAN|nr:DUF3368 domain-containing protein [Romeria gracilis]MBE9078846.1 DUF3368 domain-containing protein [Romeria aff. gracilis LEGE 07310]